MRQNRVKAALRRGEQVIGGFVPFPWPPLVEIMGRAGFDLVVIDNEHGSLDHEMVEHMVRAADAVDLVPVVRVPSDSRTEILKALDAGALGVQVPQVQDAEQAGRAVAFARYPPAGVRGAAFSVRASGYGQTRGRAYMDAANRESMVVVHVETREAVDQAERIAAVPGVDVLFVGPTDLSVSMGLDDPQHPQVQEAVRHVIHVCRRAGVAAGTLAADGAAAQRWAAAGAHYVLYSMTGFLVRVCRDLVHAGRASPVDGGSRLT